MSVLIETGFPNRFYRGKVRDIYELRQWVFIDLAGDRLLMIATDRVSAFDVVLPSGIPDKGKVLSLLSAFWFRKTASLVPNHFLELINKTWLHHNRARIFSPRIFARRTWPELEEQLVNRAMLVKRAERIPIECVVRGYLAGSAWAEYSQEGTVSGVRLAKGLKEAEQLPKPMFTPTTKAPSGHDQALSLKEMAELVGIPLTRELIKKSMAIYEYANQYARSRGIIIADTKMEFGLVEGKVVLIDELLTPDSSRFWDAANYTPGQSQPSFDKQPVRDWLVQSGWNKEPPAPALPPEVVEQTTQRYREAYRRLTGKAL